MAPTNISALGMALNGKSASVDIPRTRDGLHGRDNFTAVATNTGDKKQFGLLPTPPNSISPILPPHHRRDSHPDGPTSPQSAQIDSDIDLQHNPDQSIQQQHHSLNAEALDSLGDLDSAGAITPGLLATRYLPEILLSHGPLAIRHIMGYLTTSVPGFSRITSAKARRLVVAALEGRGGGLDIYGGHDHEVIFEKVGWGRWDARQRGQPPRDRQNTAMTPPGSLPSSYSQNGLQVPGQTFWRSGSELLGTSLTANSAVFSHSEIEYDDQDMVEHEADKMSLDDNDDGFASSEAPDPIDEDLGEGEVTDEEDWASIGAEALRARSLPKVTKGPRGSGRLYQPIASYSLAPRYDSKMSTNLAKSAPIQSNSTTNTTSAFTFPSGSNLNDSQERAAIEALLSLGSL